MAFSKLPLMSLVFFLAYFFCKYCYLSAPCAKPTDWTLFACDIRCSGRGIQRFLHCSFSLSIKCLCEKERFTTMWAKYKLASTLLITVLIIVFNKSVCNYLDRIRKTVTFKILFALPKMFLYKFSQMKKFWHSYRKFDPDKTVLKMACQSRTTCSLVNMVLAHAWTTWNGPDNFFCVVCTVLRKWDNEGTSQELCVLPCQ